MKKMNKLIPFAITLILICNTGNINAQRVHGGDHLDPVLGIFDIADFQVEYYSKVRKVLFSELPDRPEIRFHVMPSFTPEHVLDIEFNRENVKYYFIYRICEQMIWNNEKWETVKVNTFRKEVDKESVKLIKSLFSTAINQVKYPPALEEGSAISIMLDGTGYYFTVNEYGYGRQSGMVRSPDNGTKMHKLVSIGEQLIEFTKSDRIIVKFDDKLQKEIEELIDELNSD